MTQIKELKNQLQNAPRSEKPAILNKLAYILRRNAPEESRAYAQEVIAIAAANGGFVKEDAIARRSISFTYHVQGNQSAALPWAKEALQLMEDNNFTDELVTSISGLAVIFIEIGDYPQALTYFMEALAIGEEVGDEDGTALVNYNMSYLYRVMKEWELAIVHILKVLPRWEVINHLGLPYAYNGLSEVYLELGNAVNGRLYAEKSIQITQKTDDFHSLALAYLHLGESLRQQGKLDEALAVSLQGVKIEERLKANLGVIVHYLTIGKLYIQMDQFSEATYYLHKALDTAKLLDELPEMMNCYEAFINLYETQEDFKNALKYYRQYTTTKDELFNEKKQLQLTEMQTRFDSERKEKETEIYQLRNVELEQEINQRRQAEIKALRQFKYYQALLQNIPIAAITFDLNGRIENCNTAFEKVFGFTEKDIAGLKLVQLFSSKYSEDIHENMNQLLNNHSLCTITRRPHADGTPIDVELYAVPIVVSGEQTGVLALYHDIRERIAAEATLRQAKQDAEQATRAKSEFLANMSHEIRTPLNGIIGVAGLLLETSLKKEQQEYSQIIQSSGDALLTIINEILDFSKIEAGKLELEDQPFDLRHCVEDALDLVSPKAAGKGLELGYSVDMEIPSRFVGDATRFRQILVNLLGNAVKFTEEGEVVVYVNGEERENGRFQLTIAIKDTGIGIPPERQHRLFQSFSQVDSSTTRKFGGTGLGLAISKRLAELMGGSMWVESESGVGSTFHFTVEGTAVSGPKELYLQTEQPVLTDKHVLIVDDNATNRLILSRQTAAWGMIPTEARSASEGLELLHTGKPFALALVDMQMPEMSGVDFVHEMQQQQLGKQMPRILLTSLGQRDAAMRSAFDVILTKPIKPSRLYNILLNTLAENTSINRVTPKQQTSTITPIPQPLHILMAEDNRINQKVGLRMLAKLNCRADVAANGLEVLEAQARQAYDIVLMDIQMPEMDGVEATQSILKLYQEGERPYIIAMTANALNGDRETYLKAGMDDYLSKPVKLEALHCVLQKAVHIINERKNRKLYEPD